MFYSAILNISTSISYYAYLLFLSQFIAFIIYILFFIQNLHSSTVHHIKNLAELGVALLHVRNIESESYERNVK
jgi:hypothetical protein